MKGIMYSLSHSTDRRDRKVQIKLC